MSFYKNTVSSLDPEFYLKHKEYFDSRLIEVLEKSEKRIAELQEENSIYKTIIKNDKITIRDLQFKNHDLEVRYANEKNEHDQENKISENIIEGLKNEIEEQDKCTKLELSKSYKDNQILHEENITLKEIAAKLKKENEKYKKSRKMDSSNSSIPPSKDEYKKIANSREKSERNKGGQKGHKPHRSKISEQPDKVIYKVVAKAPTGAVAVFDEDKNLAYYITQEINAYLKTEITETRYVINKKAEKLPEKEMRKYRINSVTYDDEFKSMILYLNSKGMIALQRLCTMINEMSCGRINLKPSTVVNWEREFYKKSEPYRNQLLKELLEEAVVHVDETGWKINGGQGWFHVITSNDKAYFMITRWRGRDDEGPLDLLRTYIGILVHDHYKPYYELMCSHAECNAHILSYEKLEIMRSRI